MCLLTETCFVDNGKRLCKPKLNKIFLLKMLMNVDNNAYRKSSYLIYGSLFGIAFFLSSFIIVSNYIWN